MPYCRGYIRYRCSYHISSNEAANNVVVGTYARCVGLNNALSYMTYIYDVYICGYICGYIRAYATRNAMQRMDGWTQRMYVRACACGSIYVLKKTVTAQENSLFYLPCLRHLIKVALRCLRKDVYVSAADDNAGRWMLRSRSHGGLRLHDGVLAAVRRLQHQRDKWWRLRVACTHAMSGGKPPIHTYVRTYMPVAKLYRRYRNATYTCMCALCFCCVVVAFWGNEMYHRLQYTHARLDVST